MAQITDRTCHVTGLDEAADQGRGDPLAVHGLLRDDDTGQIQLPAQSLEFLCIAFAPVAKAEVMATDKARRTELQQFLQKVPPGHGHHRLHHGKRIDMVDAVTPQ